VAAFDDVVEAGDLLDVDQGFRILEEILLLERRKQICSARVEDGFSLVFRQELAGLLNRSGVEVHKGSHAAPPFSARGATLPSTLSTLSGVTGYS
jgi:hypothetical protein